MHKNLGNHLTEVLKQRYKDSNLEMTESESVALPFGDSALSMKFVSHFVTRYLVYTMSPKNASIFFIFFYIFVKQTYPLEICPLDPLNHYHNIFIASLSIT